ncbi:MAG: glutathione S-transferase family protein, partial [Pseudomonadota bacterium]
TDEFLHMNPNGRVPLLRLIDGQCLAESNAICWYLAESSALLPNDRYARAAVLQWQCFEQYNHEPNIAVARFIRQFLPWPNERVDEYHAKQAGGHQALAVMEQHLSDREWFVGESLSLADIALYAYTHVADEGGFSLRDYEALRAWLARCADALPDIRNN